MHGFLEIFAKSAAKNSKLLDSLAQSNIALVGIDPSMTLTYRREYSSAGLDVPKVQLLQEWLVAGCSDLKVLTANTHLLSLS